MTNDDKELIPYYFTVCFNLKLSVPYKTILQNYDIYLTLELCFEEK